MNLTTRYDHDAESFVLTLGTRDIAYFDADHEGIMLIARLIQLWEAAAHHTARQLPATQSEFQVVPKPHRPEGERTVVPDHHVICPNCTHDFHAVSQESRDLINRVSPILETVQDDWYGDLPVHKHDFAKELRGRNA